LELIEFAPGLELEKDIFAQMEFRPQVSPILREMDARIFRADPIGMASDLAKKPHTNIPSRLRE
jgi:propionate CoA-transferase